MEVDMERVEFIVILFLTVVSFTVAYLQYRERGPVFNNAYIYASKKERQTMNKKPYYRQSAIIFTATGSMLLFILLEMVLKNKIFFYIIIVHLIFLVVYAIGSTLMISRKHGNSK